MKKNIIRTYDYYEPISLAATAATTTTTTT